MASLMSDVQTSVAALQGTIGCSRDTPEAVQAWAGDEARWSAVVRHEAAADGAFYYAVRSTGIYCRPTCPARRPQRRHVVFFDAPQAAEQAGFRACRRCRPDEVAEWQRIVSRMQELLEADGPAPTLAQLGQVVGLSPFHLQRVFKRATGLTPRQYAAARRAARLKAELQRGASVTAAMYDAGYGSSRALYAAAPDHLGMRPNAYRRGGAGERIAYSLVETVVGRMLVAATERGVCAVRFGDSGAAGATRTASDATAHQATAGDAAGASITPAGHGGTGNAGAGNAGADDALVQALRAEFPRATLVHDPEGVAPYAQALADHLTGRRPRVDLPLDVHGTAFQQRVWAALRHIPYGETRTYAEVAQMIGQPTAVRAVAQACATNPVALVVPCHRVVRAGGASGGYRWGVARKRALLDQEGASSGAGEPSG